MKSLQKIMKAVKSVFSVMLWLTIYICHGQTDQIGNNLKIGDPAPSLSAATWIKGDPVREFRKGHIYIVDFGFIGCLPCMEGWPKLSELQKKYKEEATFVVVMTSTGPRVKKYLEKMGNRMNLNVAVDTLASIGDNQQNWVLDSLWVKAAGKGLGKNMGYPTIFFIDKKGSISYVGDGETNVQYQLDSLLGNLNKKAITKHKRKEQKRQELYDGYLNIIKYYDDELDGFITSDTYDHLEQEELENALKYMEELIDLFPDDITYKKYKFGLLLAIDKQTAYAYAREVLDSYPWEEMNNSWDLAKSWVPLIRKEFFKGERPDYDLAIAMCLKSAELSKDDLLAAFSYNDASEFSFMEGDLEKGEEFMSKAINLTTPGSEYRKLFLARLGGLKKRYFEQKNDK
ncbi:TlpA family protein disulfide reductase [Sinomicrobium weinanense]|uniref:Redoxin family protein n=1 Tax=Sinomicrobium weinanense TaxID=2842200 RepID=A0A926Q0W3_9FLAO|nr:redoxin family protein [Sinomicrobium weinanense]MBC9795128.1 redoxin family protein [Sinomicrobium weinanense]MBU3123740.1 redoxin family protein [Sinomicrobium weinanense]